ncbi:PREDICTED: RNA polymerase I-specific transcription initiation factor RRN3-like isoform X1 [Tarenaya hassleriana]|uniref:RNA polymerase I-specific transcription initiation factor RRN3-like isoform X1 n=1 Tax=Tarenaya hassleriana TaxID=28532 RepID=UPI00053C8D66|nr:PREDICTED: RNA polymerase I-specific transcription initiation factor RRN3-like isoform X1 [Tarenaya hassleriana]
MGADGKKDHASFCEEDNVNFSDEELVYYVRNALASVLGNDTSDYDELVGFMHHGGSLASEQDKDPALIATSLKALSGAVTCIDAIHHRTLLASIFGMRLWNNGPAVMNALLDLIVSLAATSGKYLDSCLYMLINHFIPPQSFSNKPPLALVHRALEDIYCLVPLAPTRLVPILAQRMPTVHKKDHLIVDYVENLLKLASSSIGEVVGDMILMMVMERLRDLDVEIGWDDIPQDGSRTSVCPMELDDDADENKIPKGSLDQKNLDGDIVCELLDNLMVLTFKHLESCHTSGHLGEVFESLFKSFEILNTYKKFAQFVIFYACSLDPDHCGVRFANNLADIFLSKSKPPLTRMSAVAYLASYLSRGKFLSTSTVAGILRRLVEACEEYCRKCGDDIKPESHRVFYSGCQAIMYVLCFRMAAIIDVPRHKSLLMPLETVLKHKLNPLTVCLPSVVTEFLRQAKAAAFTFSEAFVFEEERQESEPSNAFGRKERIDSFFPFDPCLLKTSEISYIRENYVYWGDVRKAYDDEAEGEEEDNFNEVEVIVFNDEEDV